MALNICPGFFVVDFVGYLISPMHKMCSNWYVVFWNKIKILCNPLGWGTPSYTDRRNNRISQLGSNFSIIPNIVV